jgi:Alpha/beta hydrolase domain
MAVRALECTAREPFEGYPYELVRGVAHFGVDPDSPANGRITDLARAERDLAGEVAFDADFCLVAPLEVPDGGTNLLFVVANRGLPGAIPFSLGTPWWDPTRKKIDPGDGFLLRQGWAVAWCGWQWDVLPSARSLALHAPDAVEDGRSIPGRVRLDFTSPVPMADHLLCDSSAYFAFRTYPAMDADEADAVLTVRDSIDGPRRVIDRARWRFARNDAGRPVTDVERVWLEGGFEPHRFYEVVYTTDRSPVAGAGLLAVRDFLSHLRYDHAADNPLAGAVSHVFGYGASQSGRFLRHFVHEGLNADEAGRAVFDGVLSHVAGARIGEFNQRYGQPSHHPNSGVSSLPPFSPGGPAPAGGLFDRQAAVGQMPKVFLTNTSWEYWRGDASLNHIDPEGRADLPDEPNTRT